MSFDKITDIVTKHPRHYAAMIRRDAALMQYLVHHSKAISEHIPTLVYCLLKNTSNQCDFGVYRKVSRLSEGLVGCGPATTCKCTSQKISESVIHSKKSVTGIEQVATNVKRANTMKSKYGVSHNLQREEVKDKLRSPKIEQAVYNLLMDYDWILNQYTVLNKTATEIGNELNIYYGTVIHYIKYHGIEITYRYSRSLVEKEICAYLTSIGMVPKSSDRTILKSHELDIIIESNKLAIEVNGLYWHSFNPSSGNIEQRNRHINKTIECNEHGWQLIHITDYEWKHKRDHVCSILRSKLGLNNTIYARKTTVRTLSISDSRTFLEANHIDGFVGGKVKLGLYDVTGELVSCIILGQSRFKKGHYEIIRSAHKQGLTVVGGLSKMLSHARKHIQSDIYSYCDLSKFNGNGYDQIGATLQYTTSPGFFWTDGNIIVSRYMSQKKNMHKWFVGYDLTLNEADNMFGAGYRRYWDCGNNVYKL
jgi:hypothetical protein